MANLKIFKVLALENSFNLLDKYCNASGVVDRPHSDVDEELCRIDQDPHRVDDLVEYKANDDLPD